MRLSSRVRLGDGLLLLLEARVHIPGRRTTARPAQTPSTLRLSPPDRALLPIRAALLPICALLLLPVGLLCPIRLLLRPLPRLPRRLLRLRVCGRLLDSGRRLVLHLRLPVSGGLLLHRGSLGNQRRLISRGRHGLRRSGRSDWRKGERDLLGWRHRGGRGVDGLRGVASAQLLRGPR